MHSKNFRCVQFAVGRLFFFIAQQQKMQLSQVNFSDVALSPLHQAKGVKTSAASLRGGPLEFLLTDNEFLRAPFGASAFQDPTATRLTLELTVTNSPALPLLQAVDAWVVEYAISHGLFDGWSAEEVRRTYHSPLQTSEKYPDIRLRTKIDTAGVGACKWFTHPEKEQVQYDALDLRESGLRPFIRFKGIWAQKNQWGLSLDV